MAYGMKDFWNKFTTRFAVPLLLVTQVITLYDGWESRVNERAYQEQLVHCIMEHYHHTEEDTMVTIYDTGEKITSAEFFKDSPEMDPTGQTYWQGQAGCGMFNLETPLSDYTPQRTMDRLLGKAFWTYKNKKDRFVEWVNYKFMRKATEGIRG